MSVFSMHDVSDDELFFWQSFCCLFYFHRQDWTLLRCAWNLFQDAAAEASQNDNVQDNELQYIMISSQNV